MQFIVFRTEIIIEMYFIFLMEMSSEGHIFSVLEEGK